jgi:hypothetical protein
MSINQQRDHSRTFLTYTRIVLTYTRTVAAMQADDFVAVCAFLAEVQAVAATVYGYSCKWRFKLNSLKSAVMHVSPARQPSQLVDSGIV